MKTSNSFHPFNALLLAASVAQRRRTAVFEKLIREISYRFEDTGGP